MDILKMAPRQLYEAYTQARKRPYLIHFAGYQKPWDVVDCDFAEYFWEYAKLSPYYPMILRKTKRCLMDERERNCQESQGWSRTRASGRLPIRCCRLGVGGESGLKNYKVICS
ncbi:MAG: hypothetical protein ACLTR6_14240 [Clostridium fessum]